jgi:hypothetical protein
VIQLIVIAVDLVIAGLRLRKLKQGLHGGESCECHE